MVAGDYTFFRWKIAVWGTIDAIRPGQYGTNPRCRIGKGYRGHRQRRHKQHEHHKADQRMTAT